MCIAGYFRNFSFNWCIYENSKLRLQPDSVVNLQLQCLIISLLVSESSIEISSALIYLGMMLFKCHCCLKMFGMLNNHQALHENTHCMHSPSAAVFSKHLILKVRPQCSARIEKGYGAAWGKRALLFAKLHFKGTFARGIIFWEHIAQIVGNTSYVWNVTQEAIQVLRNIFVCTFYTRTSSPLTFDCAHS